MGGHVYDRGVDGSECHWARVLVFEPPMRFVISWDLNPQWQVETDPGKTSEVEVRFTAETPERTRIELEHRNLEREEPFGMTFAWAPAYDWELTVWESPPTDISPGWITVLIKGRWQQALGRVGLALAGRDVQCRADPCPFKQMLCDICPFLERPFTGVPGSDSA